MAALVGVLVSLPALAGLLPASDASVSAPDLRAAVLASDTVGFSGFAESAGGLDLPVTDQLTSVADLFSDRTRMRVWWRGPIDHRVDVISAGGETGVHRDLMGSWAWEYERATATRTLNSALALPRPPDLLPSTLGRRLLSEATVAEVSRIGALRVAGRDALGLRLTPTEPASSVGRVDIWVDADTGLPLKVEVFGKGAALPALETRFLDFDPSAPDPSTTAFVAPPAAAIRGAPVTDVALEAGRRIRPVPLPPELAGLPRRVLTGVPPGIGLFGRGVTLLAVVPLPSRLAAGLRDALVQSPDAVVDEAGVRVSAGPVALMLLDPPGHGPYVLTGTVTLDALADAAAQLPELGGTP
ncbi:MAG: putative sigma regulatory protein MucB/RseB [Blastococcus sp.]|nr:putative sigma regulatory protein MucB/RseB [Blastococcus sp.]